MLRAVSSNAKLEVTQLYLPLTLPANFHPLFLPCLNLVLPELLQSERDGNFRLQACGTGKLASVGELNSEHEQVYPAKYPSTPVVHQTKNACLFQAQVSAFQDVE